MNASTLEPLDALYQAKWGHALPLPPEPELRADYQQLGKFLVKPETPLKVIVTARGELDLDLPLFQYIESKQHVLQS